jgi:hypothetical protein
MAGVTVGDAPEWEYIKKEFINSEASSKGRILAIQRLAKECAVGMDDAETIVDRWGGERRDEALNAREKFAIGDALNDRPRREKR